MGKILLHHRRLLPLFSELFSRMMSRFVPKSQPMNNRPRYRSMELTLPPRERTTSTDSLIEDGTKRRSSSRAIKRPKFDDELVESSLGGQSSTPISKIRTRNPSLSTASDCSVSLPPTPSVTSDVRKRLSSKSSSKRARKGRGSQSIVTKDLGRWKPTDDLSLIIGVQQTCDLVTVHRGVKFSCKFTLAEVQERWYALLYDPTVSRIAQQAMKNLHPDQIQAVQSRALYSKAEEELLGVIKSNSNPGLQTFETLLQENPNVFYPARTAKALMAHWHLLKQYHLLPDQTVPPLNKNGPVKDFSEAEQQIHDSELYESSDDLLEHELGVASRGSKREIRLLEDQVSKWQVLVDTVTGISPPEFDNQTLAVLRGRLVRYLMRSREITLGRKAAGVNVDVDLSLEGPAWKISRRQGIIKLRNTGDFLIANEGKRPIYVDGKPVLAGNKTKLNNNSVVEIASLRFIFLINLDLINVIRQETAKLSGH
ncbi:microspherule protein 1-like isoform X1 [Penaeus chinensis]|uniref:microspherule protein 1-like isoform X1 n=2 Tax=Penaeus TaxID=133894 RepID=UPI001FB7AADC|nr:microspherule protein 1-like isoform X1 [Penaeus chinensis]